MAARGPNQTDVYVGSRVRLLRNQQDMTQERLAERLGVSFQQLQKYEKGLNRISASRLQHLAKIFDVPVHYFFEGSPRLDGFPRKNKQDASVNDIENFIAGAEGKALAKAFLQIKDTMVRRSIVHMVEALSESGKR